MLQYAGDDLSHVLIADTMNHTKHCRYIVNPPGVDAAVHQHVGIGEGEVNFDALFQTLRDMELPTAASRSAANRSSAPHCSATRKDAEPGGSDQRAHRRELLGK